MTKNVKSGASAGSKKPYQLISYNRYGVELETQGFVSPAEMAYTAYRARWYLQENARDWFVPSTRAVDQKALSPHGKEMNMAELVAWGATVSRGRSPWCKQYGYVRRCGPVHGIHKWGRGGPSNRASRTQQERRNNACVLTEEGEVSARAARCGSHVPDSWDEKPRCLERNWKSQHKGRKSWDRRTKHGRVATM